MGRLTIILSGTAVLWSASLYEFGSAPNPPHARATSDEPAIGLVSPANAARPPAPQKRNAPAQALRPEPHKSSARRSTDDDENDEDDIAEDQAMAASDHTPEQRVWRMAWSAEEEDPEWTRRVGEELRAMSKTLAQGDVTLSDLSCRQTVCLMELQFADQLDAQAFIAAPHDPALEYEYQSMDPAFDGAGFDQSEHSYELLIKRPSADYLPQREPE